MGSEVVRIGIREFRLHLPQYLLATKPVAITRHGETVGFYIPTHERQEQDRDSLRVAASKLDIFLKANGLTEDGLLSEFRAMRETKSK